MPPKDIDKVTMKWGQMLILQLKRHFIGTRTFNYPALFLKITIFCFKS